MARIEVLEGLSMPGSLERENEDAMGATHFVAFVLDGVTGVGDGLLLPGKSDAAWVAHAARDLLVEHGKDSGTDLAGLITKVATGITQRFEKERTRAPNARYELPWTTLSMIGVEPGRINIAFLGDSRALIETDDDEVHNIGPHPSRNVFEQRVAAKMLAARKEQSLSVDTIRATVLDDLRRSRDTVNTEKGYWLLGADAAVGSHVQVTSIPLTGPATALLATDGFYALVEDYRHYGDRELIANAQTLGLKILGRELRHVEDDDPVGERFPRMKKSDDATALLVRIEP